MSQRIGLATKLLRDLPFRVGAELAARIGYRGLEVFALPEHFPGDVRDYRRVLDDLGLTAIDFCTYDVGLAESGDAECEAAVERFARSLEIANELGAPMVRAWADRLGRYRITPREDHILRAAHYLGRMADRAAGCSAAVLLETHPELTRSVEAKLRLLALIDRTNVKINYDPANAYLCGEPYGYAATSRLAPHVANVQVKEASTSLPTGEQDDHDGTLRNGGTFDLLLGAGDMCFAPVVAALRDAGYAGWYVAECHKTGLPSERIASHEYDALARLLTTA